MAGHKPLLYLGIIWILTITDTTGEYSCPAGWRVFRDECLYMETATVSTWHQAKGKCDALNASMLTIDDEQKNLYISRETSRNSWLGLHKESNEDDFFWLSYDKHLPVNYTSWSRGEPDQNSENCVFMQSYSRYRGQWNDVSCQHVRRYICEKPDSGDCDDGWQSFGDKCYSASNETTSWPDARTACQQNGADLVVIETVEENQFLIDEFVQFSDMWIGLNDVKKEGDFCWLDQAFNEDSWMNFKTMEPNNGYEGFKDCGYLTYSASSYSRGRWSVTNCNSYLNFICEKVATKDADGNSTCGADWFMWSNSCYMMGNNASARWDLARKHCQQNGADLVVIETQEESNYLADKIFGHSWMGINDRSGENIWHWLDNSTNSTFFNWRNGPSRRYDYNCVQIYATHHNLGKWANYRCTQSAAYICESTVAVSAVNATWVVFAGHYYLFNLSAATWERARVLCQAVNNYTDLVVISTSEEQQFINFNIAGNVDTRGFWTGVNSIKRRYYFTALNSTQNVTYTNWGVGEPNYLSQEWCVEAFRGRRGSGNWNDKDCEETDGVICQQPATGGPSYFDFSFGNSVYKIVAGSFFPKQGNQYCREKYGRNATMAIFETQDELDRVSAEMNVRFSSMGSFWINGTKEYNETSTTARGPGRPGMRMPRRPPSADTGPCNQLRPVRIGSWRDRKFIYQVVGSVCCEGTNLLCEKHIDPEKTKRYDFGFNSSIYKIILEAATKEKALEQCRSALYGGHLVEINSQSEMNEIAKELVIRHVGATLEYWVAGNTTQKTNLTSSVLQLTAQTEQCKMTMFGYEYRGNTSTTREGKTCQRWDSQTPHQHQRNNLHYLGDATLDEAANHCRNPNLSPDGPWCFTMDPNTRWQYCDVPACKVAECRTTKLGAEYNGVKQTTTSGKTCLRWDSKSPAPALSGFRDSSLKEAQNYCRNPDNKPTGPWCYTSDPATPWESCDVPYCWSNCRVTGFGSEYMGTINTTVAGLTCQRWDMDYPHGHSKAPAKFPDASMTAAENYCRNPDMETWGAWCYTTNPSVRWQYCNIPMCTAVEVEHPETKIEIYYDTTKCKVTPYGWEYNGTISVTKTGLACQKWTDQSPHQHTRNDPEAFPDATTGDAVNYCRNPTHDSGGPWCYTMDPNTRWQNCIIPNCTDGDCLMMSHPDFKNHQETDKLVLAPSSCGGSKPFVCEQTDLDQSSVFDDWRDVVNNFLNKSIDEPKMYPSTVKDYVGGGCQGPCIGLLVSYPFFIILTVFLTLAAYRYYTRRIPFSFGFNKQSDEVYLTP